MASRAISVAARLALAAAFCAPWAAAQATPPQLPGGATTATPAMPLPAEGTTALTGAIMQRLSNDPVLGSQTITANVGKAGLVTLNGVVPQEAYATRAVALVKSIPGVSGVNDQILVNQDSFAPPPPQESTALPLTTALPPPPAATDPQARIADALAKVPALARVSAQIYDQKVVLFGTVASDQAKQQAERIVRSIVPRMPLVNIIWKDSHPLAPPPLVPQNG